MCRWARVQGADEDRRVCRRDRKESEQCGWRERKGLLWRGQYFFFFSLEAGALTYVITAQVRKKCGLVCDLDVDYAVALAPISVGGVYAEVQSVTE